MPTITLELWQFVSGMAVLTAAIAWLVRLSSWQSSHERECSQRYTQLVKVSDERHTENGSRLTRLEAKLDTLLER